MEAKAIRNKFGDEYVADEHTFKMGIDHRFTRHFAERFKNLTVLETCTGGGFTTISLAKFAQHVYTVEIDKVRQKQAISNISRAKLLNKVSFIHGNVLDQDILNQIRKIDSAFIDPDWADSQPNHIYRFLNSTTKPPADIILNKIFHLTESIALILPPFIGVNEFRDLPVHECERLFLDDKHELYCLYFGNLINSIGATEYRL